jgi:uncharacterized membrane protein YuzA (DUF378 family)
VKTFYWIALVLLVIGGLNWALVGLFNFDLVATLFGEMSGPARAVYTLVGISALVVLLTSPRLLRENNDRVVTQVPS